MTGIQLLLLRCPACGSSIHGDQDGIFLYCSSCGKGFERRGDDLTEIPVYFARLNQNAQSPYPFWAFDATLSVTRRDASTTFKSFFGSSSGLVKLFQERTHLRFYVPAFRDDLSTEKPAGLRLTLEQPELEFVHPGSTVPDFSISQDDARKLADFLLLTSEIQQPDMLRSIDYKLTLENPMMIVIAF